MGNHPKLVVGTATLFLALILAAALFFTLRPPYSIRQLQLGAHTPNKANTRSCGLSEQFYSRQTPTPAKRYSPWPCLSAIREYHTAYRDYI